MSVAAACCAVALATVGSASGASRPTVIMVVAGKPNELAFTLSRSGLLPPGTIEFKIRNAGASPHDFVLCEYPVANASRNSCAGYQSRDLQPGEATTITIRSIKKGTYEFLSTDPGDAAGGMKGLLGVGVVVKQLHAEPKPVPGPVAPTPSSNPSSSSAAEPSAPMTTAPVGNYLCSEKDGSIQEVNSPDACTGSLTNPNG